MEKQTNNKPHFDIINILKYQVHVQNKTKKSVFVFICCIVEKHALWRNTFKGTHFYVDSIVRLPQMATANGKRKCGWNTGMHFLTWVDLEVWDNAKYIAEIALYIGPFWTVRYCCEHTLSSLPSAADSIKKYTIITEKFYSHSLSQLRRYSPKYTSVFTCSLVIWFFS